MKNIVVASTRKGSGKTSAIIGMGRASGKKVGYLKPLGDRLLYKKKRQWDYDSAAVTALCALDESPETMTLGFEHAKLRYMYDEEGIRERLAEAVSAIEMGKEVIFFEAGETIASGISVNLDAVSMARHVNGTLVLVASGTPDSIVDDVTLLKRYFDSIDLNFGGLIINKLRDIEDFKDTHLPQIEELGIKVLGMLPHVDELTHFSVQYIADKLFAKVLAGEAGLSGVVKHIAVGAMSVDAVMKAPVFSAESKLVVTSGDRSDMILAALETHSSAIVLTNDIIPPANIVSMATDMKVPLLLVRSDTFATAKQLDDMEALTSKDDAHRGDVLAEMMRENVNLSEIL